MVDLSPDASASSTKKRKIEGDLDSAPDRKRKSGTRRNALWSVEDDEKFTQAYNTVCIAQYVELGLINLYCVVWQELEEHS
jgi:hypothetical protein